MSFLDIINQHDPQQVLAEIESRTVADVEKALAAERLGTKDLQALLSPAAEPFLERMAQVIG